MMRTQESVFLHVQEPTSIISWEAFTRQTLPYSIALDGFVSGPSAIDYRYPHANFNHHEGVVRFATRATCEQVKVAIDLGLFRLFQKNNVPYAKLYINDWDQDVILSVYQLTRYPHAKGPLMTRLINVQGLLDMSAGSYPIDPDEPILREFAWIFEPYVEARMSGRLNTMMPDEMRRGIELVCGRIDEYMLGRGQQVPLNTEYKVMRRGTGWALVEMIGYYARIKMRQDGMLFFVNYRGRINGNVVCSIGCDPFVNADLPGLFKKLSVAEPNGRPWGGGDSIGATPRGVGSVQTLDQIFEIVEQHVTNLKD